MIPELKLMIPELKLMILEPKLMIPKPKLMIPEPKLMLPKPNITISKPKATGLPDSHRNTAVTAPANSVATSHIDFIVEEIPNPRPNPDIFGGRTVKPGGRIKQLGLDILVSGR